MAEKAIGEQDMAANMPPVIRYPSAARVSVAFDNMDINEDTLTGSSTTHVTNGIAVQRHGAWCSPPPRAGSDVTTAKRRRSLPAPVYEVPDYNASVRCGAAAIAAPESALANTGSPGNDHRVLLWGMSRLSSKDDSLLGRPDTTVGPGFVPSFKISKKIGKALSHTCRLFLPAQLKCQPCSR